MIDGIQSLSRQLVDAPDSLVRQPSRSETQKAKDQVDLLSMSIGVRGGNQS